jgi:hypothetical protein
MPPVPGPLAPEPPPFEDVPPAPPAFPPVPFTPTEEPPLQATSTDAALRRRTDARHRERAERIWGNVARGDMENASSIL